MKRSNCTKIQSELDEMLLGEDCAAEVSQHLGECSECRVFHEKQIKLRQIVGSLGTVSAPADFDFRLRSRLAHENSNSGFHLSSLVGFGQRTAVVATALALIVAAVFVYRNFTNRNEVPQTVAVRSVPGFTPALPSPEPKPTQQISSADDNPQAVAVKTPSTGTDSKAIKRIVSTKSRNKSVIVSEAFSSTRAPGFGGQSQSGAERVFPIDAAQQSLKVSLFDSRGNPRTISLPPVSFGSQRLVPTTASLAPKGVW